MENFVSCFNSIEAEKKFSISVRKCGFTSKDKCFRSALLSFFSNYTNIFL